MHLASTITLIVVMMMAMAMAQETSDRGQECRALNTRADLAFQGILWIGDRRQAIPRTTVDMEAHCKAMKDSVRTFRSYGKCVRLFPKQVFSIVATNTRKTIKARCDTDVARQEFLNVTRCYSNDTKERLDIAMDRMAVFTQYVTTSAIAKDDKLPWVCCGYQYTGNVTTAGLAQDCGRETLDYTSGIMKSLFSDVMDLTCGKYSSIVTCKEQLPASLEKYEQIAQQSELKPNSSLWKPLLKITRSLERSD